MFSVKGILRTIIRSNGIWALKVLVSILKTMSDTFTMLRLARTNVTGCLLFNVLLRFVVLRGFKVS